MKNKFRKLLALGLVSTMVALPFAIGNTSSTNNDPLNQNSIIAKNNVPQTNGVTIWNDNDITSTYVPTISTIQVNGMQQGLSLNEGQWDANPNQIKDIYYVEHTSVTSGGNIDMGTMVEVDAKQSTNSGYTMIRIRYRSESWGSGGSGVVTHEDWLELLNITDSTGDQIVYKPGGDVFYQDDGNGYFQLEIYFQLLNTDTYNAQVGFNSHGAKFWGEQGNIIHTETFAIDPLWTPINYGVTDSELTAMIYSDLQVNGFTKMDTIINTLDPFIKNEVANSNPGLVASQQISTVYKDMSGNVLTSSTTTPKEFNVETYYAGELIGTNNVDTPLYFDITYNDGTKVENTLLQKTSPETILISTEEEINISINNSEISQMFHNGILLTPDINGNYSFKMTGYGTIGSQVVIHWNSALNRPNSYVNFVKDSPVPSIISDLEVTNITSSTAIINYYFERNETPGFVEYQVYKTGETPPSTWIAPPQQPTGTGNYSIQLTNLELGTGYTVNLRIDGEQPLTTTFTTLSVVEDTVQWLEYSVTDTTALLSYAFNKNQGVGYVEYRVYEGTDSTGSTWINLGTFVIDGIDTIRVTGLLPATMYTAEIRVDNGIADKIEFTTTPV